jgi:hypothetical protein
MRSQVEADRKKHEADQHRSSFDKLQGKFFGEVEEPASVAITLERNTKYSDAADAPTSGYFEFMNKSTEFVCVKVLLPGGNRKFEVPRPSYFAVPPNHSVCADYEPSTDGLELAILYKNPHPLDSRLIYETRAPGATMERISACARVDNFQCVAYYTMNSERKNTLLKYKGDGHVMPRVGNAVGRIGVFNRLRGRRAGSSGIDYDTNTDKILLEFMCMT